MVPALEILACTSCGAPLPLADTDTVTCSSCGTVNPVPAAYRELHRARQGDRAARVEGEAVLHHLDHPPSLAVKVAARVFDQPMFVFFLLFGIPVGLAAIFFALDAGVWIARLAGVRSADDVPFGVTVGLAFLALFVFALVPRALGIYANRRVTGRQRLLAALAARPPKTPGGPALCRRCGAPLAVVPGELVAVCSYCRAENAVQLETRLVVATTDAVRQLAATVRDVAERDREQRHDTRRQLARTTARYALRTALFGTGFAFSAQSAKDGEPTVLAIVAVLGTTALTFYFIITSIIHHEHDDGRLEGNDAPQWVGVLGPIVACALMFYGLRFL